MKVEMAIVGRLVCWFLLSGVVAGYISDTSQSIYGEEEQSSYMTFDFVAPSINASLSVTTSTSTTPEAGAPFDESQQQGSVYLDGSNGGVDEPLSEQQPLDTQEPEQEVSQVPTLAPGEMPYFVESMSSQNITVNPGETAMIVCVVKNLGNHLVIWRRDDQIVPLTIGRSRHVLDERIAADVNSLTGEWMLVIRDAKSSDSGRYRCQVNVIQEDGTYLERVVIFRVRDIPLLVIDAREAVQSSDVFVAKLAGMTALPRPVLYDLLRHTPSLPPQHERLSGGWLDGEPTTTTTTTPSVQSEYNQNEAVIVPPIIPTKYRGRHHNNRHLGLFSSYLALAGDLAIGGSEYVEKGQNVELTCNATSASPHSDRPPHSVEWFRDGEKLESSRESGYFITRHAVGRTLYSTLIVYKAELRHAGDYVCRVPDLNALENWRVTVLNIQPGTVKRGTGSLVDHSGRSAGATLASLSSSYLVTSLATCHVLLLSLFVRFCQ